MDTTGVPAGDVPALITGPAGVGKSAIGFRFYRRCLGAGLTTGYVDLSQLGFPRPPAAGDPGSQRLEARNLGAIWRNYRAVIACEPAAASCGSGSCHAARPEAGRSPGTACAASLSPDESASMIGDVIGWP